jgi:hypothetical protein
MFLVQLPRISIKKIRIYTVFDNILEVMNEKRNVLFNCGQKYTLLKFKLLRFK